LNFFRNKSSQSSDSLLPCLFPNPSLFFSFSLPPFFFLLPRDAPFLRQNARTASRDFNAAPASWSFHILHMVLHPFSKTNPVVRAGVPSLPFFFLQVDFTCHQSSKCLTHWFFFLYPLLEGRRFWDLQSIVATIITSTSPGFFPSPFISPLRSTSPNKSIPRLGNAHDAALLQGLFFPQARPSFLLSVAW